MKHFFLLSILFTSILSAQDKNTINGTITDSKNGETLFGASVYFKNTTIGVLTNEYGFYSLTAPKGSYSLTVSYMGYDEFIKEIELDVNQKIDFELTESSNELQEVVLIAEESERMDIKAPQMSVSKLNIGTIKKMPSFKD
jgi:hypothetical protein